MKNKPHKNQSSPIDNDRSLALLRNIDKNFFGNFIGMGRAQVIKLDSETTKVTVKPQYNSEDIENLSSNLFNNVASSKSKTVKLKKLLSKSKHKLETQEGNKEVYITFVDSVSYFKDKTAKVMKQLPKFKHNLGPISLLFTLQPSEEGVELPEELRYFALVYNAAGKCTKMFFPQPIHANGRTNINIMSLCYIKNQLNKELFLQQPVYFEYNNVKFALPITVEQLIHLQIEIIENLGQSFDKIKKLITKNDWDIFTSEINFEGLKPLKLDFYSKLELMHILKNPLLPYQGLEGKDFIDTNAFPEAS